MRYYKEKFKEWAVRVTEPWREEQASLDLAWLVFARRHNTTGNRPICVYDGWEKDLDPREKATVYEFPNGDPDALPGCLGGDKDDPHCLIEVDQHTEEQVILTTQKKAGSEDD